MEMCPRALPLLLGPSMFALMTAAGCGRSPPSAGAKVPSGSEPPAKVERPQKESDLTVVRLTTRAEERLKIQTAPVEERDLERTRTIGAEALALPGLAVVVGAPLAGTLARSSRTLKALTRFLSRDSHLCRCAVLPTFSRWKPLRDRRLSAGAGWGSSTE